MIESTNSFCVPDDEIEMCAYCGCNTHGDEICYDCEKLDLMQCTNCAEYYRIEDMVDDDCVLCITNYRR